MPGGMPVADTRTVGAIERLVTAAVGLTTRTLAQARVASDITLPQWRALVVVAQADGIRVGEIGARVGLGLPAASRLVRRLERRGLVTTERDERDRRATVVRPTDRGRRLWRDVEEHRCRLIEAMLDARTEPLPERLPEGLEELASTLSRYA